VAFTVSTKRAENCNLLLQWHVMSNSFFCYGVIEKSYINTQNRSRMYQQKASLVYGPNSAQLLTGMLFKKGVNGRNMDTWWKAWCQFHQHFTRAFCANIFAPKITKLKHKLRKLCEPLTYEKHTRKILMKLEARSISASQRKVSLAFLSLLWSKKKVFAVN